MPATQLPRIGFIGLGNMGANMARCIQRHNFPLKVFDLDRDAATTLIEYGAHFAESAADCADNTDILITSLPKPQNVEQVMAGDSGALAAMQPGSTWIDMTTNDRNLIAELAEQAAAREIVVIDAPVTGAVDGARKGKLTIFAGGQPEVLARVSTVLEAMGEVIPCGDLGTGNAVKLVTNYLWFSHAAVVGEGLLLGKQAGVSLEVLWDAIKRSVGDSFVARHDIPSIFAGHYDPSFSLGLCLKDLGLCEQLAATGGVPTPIGDVVQRRFQLAAETYGEQAGELHVAKLLEDATGTSLQLELDFTPHWEV